MCFIVFLTLNAYFVYQDVGDKISHCNTLFVACVLILIAITFSLPRPRAG